MNIKKKNLKNINKEIVQILNRFGTLPEKIPSRFNFIETGFVDSLNLMKFITIIEKKYKININDKYTSSKKFGELNDLVKKINSYKKK